MTNLRRRGIQIPRTGLIGARGYGGWHLNNMLRLQRGGKLQLTAIADPHAGDEIFIKHVPPDVQRYANYEEMLSEQDLAFVVVSSPPHLHKEHSIAALESGSAVLVEKPAAPTIDDLEEMIAAQARFGRICEVGYQSLASEALSSLCSLVRAGRLGRIESITGGGAWSRSAAYFRRSSWAGRLFHNSYKGLDGTFFNPFSHLLLNALVVAVCADGSSGAPTSVRAELYRANDIQCDDTSCVAIQSAGGTPIFLAVTLCARRKIDPFVRVKGTLGEATWRYEGDDVDIRLQGENERSIRGGRADLLENLLASENSPDAVFCPLQSAVDVTVAGELILLSAKAPTPIPSGYLQVDGKGGDERTYIRNIESTIVSSLETAHLFSDMGIDWARATSTVGPAHSMRPRAVGAK